ncbi:MAG: DNA gyrase subunit A [Erysipelotrichaceae bacterium]|nr:DNA gyrase subunit A [Erysipelotrichaceae bacterium]
MADINDDKYNEDESLYFNHGKITDINISNEMRDNFLSYSMSVIIDRALPDIKDGLKPVHRRVLWAMYSIGNTPDKPHIKSANIVGEVLGKYHPHGDTAAYDTMVRMAQDFSYRYPLVDGHGNFGSVDGDEAAAMRYTEARMSKISLEMVQDIRKETIDWKDNYDARFKEPVVMPSRFPNLLVNGSMGIAVGMATNMPPHNLNEAIDAIIATIDDPEISVVELMDKYISGPDFPTGGYIIGRSGIRKAYETGRGSIICRSRIDVEEMKNGKKRLIVREIPYLVNKAMLVEKIASLVRDKVIDGITSLVDESNRNGIRIVMEVRKDVQVDVLLNQLYRLTQLQTNYGVNNNVLVDNRPMLLPLKEIIRYYIEHQIEVIERRTRFDLNKAQERAHLLEGLKIAVDNIDEVVHTIRSAKDNDEAMKNLMERFGLDEVQAKAILEMQLRRLTGLEREKIVNELNELYVTIDDLKDILNNHGRVLEIIKNELTVIKEKYGDKRRTEILEGEYSMEDEELIPEGGVIISMTKNGYIKRLPIDTYRAQNRGGRGIKGLGLNEDDDVEQNVAMSTHDFLLLFSNRGRVFRIKGYEIPEASRNAKGLPLINLLKLDKDEKIKTLVVIQRDKEIAGYLFFVTMNGLCKRVPAEEFESIRQNGKIAISLKDDDELVAVLPTSGEDEIIMGASNGKAVRFNENDVRPMGRTASGVKGMNVDGSRIIGVCTNREGQNILVVSRHGYGKQTPIADYRMTSRGAKGVKTININEKNGDLVALKAVRGDEDCLIMASDGVVIRFSLEDVSMQGRATQGVRLIKPTEGAYVSSITILDPLMAPEEEEKEPEQETSEE